MQPVYFAEFLENGVDQCGSDSVYKLDGRNTMHNMVADAQLHLRRMANIHPSWNGFRICFGTFCKRRILMEVPNIN